MFGKRSKKSKVSYDKTGKFPVIRASICTGEKVAGFKKEATGKFEELMLIRTIEDQKEFMNVYGISSEEEIRKEW